MLVDHNKHSCFSLLLVRCLGGQYNSINEYYLHHIWNSASAKLCVLCVLATHSVFPVPFAPWDEDFFNTATLATEGPVMLNSSLSYVS